MKQTQHLPVVIGKRSFYPVFRGKLPTLTDDEIEAMRRGLSAEKRVASPVIVNQHDHILDGDNRLCAAAELGFALKDIAIEQRHTSGPAEDWAICLRFNLGRRHMTTKQKRAVIEIILKENPSQTDRAVGKQVGADGKTVADVREEMERRAEIPHVEERTDSKGRKQPAHKAQPQRDREPGEDDEEYDRRDEEREAKRKEKNKPKPKAKDATGRVIPDCQKDFFGDPLLPESVAWLEETRSEVQKLVDRLKRKVLHYPFVHVKTLYESLEDTETALLSAHDSMAAGIPYAVCSPCEGKGCKRCRNAGHLPEWRFNELQEQEALS